MQNHFYIKDTVQGQKAWAIEFLSASYLLNPYRIWKWSQMFISLRHEWTYRIKISSTLKLYNFGHVLDKYLPVLSLELLEGYSWNFCHVRHIHCDKGHSVLYASFWSILPRFQWSSYTCQVKAEGIIIKVWQFSSYNISVFWFQVKWMMYWIVFALFCAAETFADVFLSWWENIDSVIDLYNFEPY